MTYYPTSISEVILFKFICKNINFYKLILLKMSKTLHFNLKKSLNCRFSLKNFFLQKKLFKNNCLQFYLWGENF